MVIVVADGVRNLEGNIGLFGTWRERSDPPGSKSGARMQRGSPETWESLLSPANTIGQVHR